jgi:O-antigen/teichoic acid export membrane protein
MLKRLLSGASAMIVGQFLNIASNLLLVPLFLTVWSSGIYGEWLALSSVVAYFSVTDLGMNSAAVNAMTAAYARGDLDHYSRLQGSAMAFYLGMAASLSVAFGLFGIIAPVPAWIGIHQIRPQIAGWALWLLAVRFLWQMPAAQICNIYRTMGNLAATQWLANIRDLGILGVTLLVLAFRGGVLSLAGWSLVPMLLVTGGAAFALRRSHWTLLPVLGFASWKCIQELLGLSVYFGLIMLCMALTIQGPIVLAAKTLGGTAVALLVTTRTVANVVRQVIGTLNNTLWPELTRMDAIGDSAALQASHRSLVAGSTALCAAFAGALWFEGENVLVLWTRGRLLPDVWLLRLFLVAIVLQAPWSASSMFAVASNRHRRLAGCYLASAVVAIGLVSVLIRRCGLLSIPIGICAGEAVACYHFVIKDSCETIGENYREYAVRLWVGVAATTATVWSAGWIGHSLAVGPMLLRWLEVGAITTVAAIITAGSIILNGQDRARILRRCRKAPAPHFVNVGL